MLFRAIYKQQIYINGKVLRPRVYVVDNVATKYTVHAVMQRIYDAAKANSTTQYTL